MSYLELVPDNPVSAARADAKRSLFGSLGFEVTDKDEGVLAGLDSIATAMGFIDQEYFVTTGLAYAIPVTYEMDGEMEYMKRTHFSFDGVFRCYSRVHIGEVVGERAVRALCASFDEVTMLPYFDGIKDDELLHVPILAVDSIDQTHSLDD